MARLREMVILRARNRCEYCQLPQSFTILPHELDHIVAQQHQGATVPENLCLACAMCNAHKGPNLSGIDPESGKLTRLFNPRQDVWDDHFRWRGAVLEGVTDVGRTTVNVLSINSPERVTLRETLLEAKVLDLQD